MTIRTDKPQLGDRITFKRSFWRDLKTKQIIYQMYPTQKMRWQDRLVNWINRKRQA